ncbi:MAG TPA: ParB/RepB/Spo0J family partition protein [Vicinamibacterales bacterium]|nr:ParB/RepB/Spo0J family partition protein [Vicinamibacterales bacterium]
MSDSFDITSGPDFSNPADRSYEVDFESETIGEREGLPRTYRMRADRHYVDQIAAEVGHPVRMLPLASIESDARETAGDLRPLIESVRALGIVHPLLVNRHNERYHVITGHKRFAVAQVLHLETVPCIVRDVGPFEAAELAVADNLTTGRQRLENGRDFSVVRQLIAEHLHRVMRASQLPVGYPNAGLDESGARIVRAHAWRAAYLLDVMEVLEHAPAGDAVRTSAMASVVDDTLAAFAPEMQLRRVDLRIEIGGYYTAGVDRRHLSVALAGAIFATLAVIGEAPGATIVVRNFDRAADGPALEISQTHRSVGQATLDDLLRSDAVLDQHTDVAGAIGAVAARTVVERCGGTMELLASAGTRVTMTFPT